MSNRYQIYKDSAIAEGRVELRLIDDETGRVKNTSIGNNDLSPANKIRVAHIAGQYLGDMKESPMGKALIVGQDGISKCVAADVDKQRAIVLLNLENKVYSDTYIPVYDVNGTIFVEDTVIGWVNSCNNSGANPYLGNNVNKTPKQSIRALGSMSELRGWFDTNKALGKITHVGVMSGFGDAVTLNPYYGGFSIWECLARSNSYSFVIPPNIRGVTGVDEILIYNVYGDNKFYKVNLVNGTETNTALDVSNFNLSGTRYKTGAFKRIDDGRVAILLDSYIYIWEFDDAGNCVTRLKYGLGTTVNISGFFELASDPGYIYFSCLKSNTGIEYRKIDLSTYSVNEVTLDSLGGLPSHWSNDGTDVIVIANSGSRYYIVNSETGEGIYTSDLSDVCGNIVGTMAYPGEGFSIFETSFKSDMMFISKPSRYQDIEIDGLKIKTDVANPEGVTDTVSISDIYLPWISYGNYSNWYNVYKLSSPIEKTSSDTVDLSYAIGYKN